MFDDAADSSGVDNSGIDHTGRDRADSLASTGVDILPAISAATAAAVIVSAPSTAVSTATAASAPPVTAAAAVEVPDTSTKQQVGEGMAAARNMYATTSAASTTTTAVKVTESSPTTSSLPFHSPELQPHASIATPGDLPKADLFGPETPSELLSAPAPSSSRKSETAGDLGNWIQCYDDESGWPYVYNEHTGEVKWVEPESTEQLLAVLWEVCYDQDGNQFYYNQVNRNFIC